MVDLLALIVCHYPPFTAIGSGAYHVSSRCTGSTFGAPSYAENHSRLCLAVQTNRHIRSLISKGSLSSVKLSPFGRVRASDKDVDSADSIVQRASIIACWYCSAVCRILQMSPTIVVKDLWCLPGYMR